MPRCSPPRPPRVRMTAPGNGGNQPPPPSRTASACRTSRYRTRSSRPSRSTRRSTPPSTPLPRSPWTRCRFPRGPGPRSGYSWVSNQPDPSVSASTRCPWRTAWTSRLCSRWAPRLTICAREEPATTPPRRRDRFGASRSFAPWPTRTGSRGASEGPSWTPVGSSPTRAATALDPSSRSRRSRPRRSSRRRTSAGERLNSQSRTAATRLTWLWRTRAASSLPVRWPTWKPRGRSSWMRRSRWTPTGPSRG